MKKRGKDLFNYNITIFEIGLLILSSFAVAFILEENLVNGLLF